MKKVTFVTLLLGFLVSSYAQRVEIIKTIDNPHPVNNGLVRIDIADKHSVVKSAAAVLSNVSTGNNAQYGNYIQYTVTPNDECVRVGILVQEAGVVSGAVQSGMTPSAVFEIAEQQYQAQGQSVYEDVTPNQPITKATVQLDASKDYEIAVLAIGTSADSVFSYQTVSFNASQSDKDGIAQVKINITEVTSSNAKLQFIINDQTSYFYYLAGYTENLESEGLTDLNFFKNSIDALIQQQYVSKLTSSAEGNLPNLQSETSYTVVALAYNGKNEAGEGDVQSFTTSSVALTDITDVKTSVYPNPVSDKLIVSSPYVINRIELYNSCGQKIYLSSLRANGSVIDVKDLVKGLYILKVYTDDGVFVSNVTVQ